MEQLASFLPNLPQSDIEQASSLIQSAYAPGQPAEQQRRLQQELHEIQRRPQAWGLVVPLLAHGDPNVQFFGAHTAQVKIARDWDAFPQEYALLLRDVLVQLAGRTAGAGGNVVALRKLFVAITSLAFRLVPTTPTKWPDWMLMVVTALSGHGASRESILTFLEIVAEEVASADFVASSKLKVEQTLTDSKPLVLQAVNASLTTPGASSREQRTAFKCLQEWIQFLDGDELTTLVPLLIHLLSSEETFVGASDVLQEVMYTSPLASGAGTKTLTEPLVEFLSRAGPVIVEQTVSTGVADEISHSLCKLLVALGEHSIAHFAARLSAPSTQAFLKLLFAYTALPGYYGVDEEESEMTLAFWYELQEALWSADYGTADTGVADFLSDGDGGIADGGAGGEGQEWTVIAKQLYLELVVVLKRKVTWPPAAELATWTRDQRDKFQIYRRDIADTLINAYYVLRKDMFQHFVEEISQELANRAPDAGWENVEAILHCVTSIQEAAEMEENPYLNKLFGPDILGRLPLTGLDRVRKTTLSLIGAYATWFTVPADPSLLLNALNYVVDALAEPTLCLPAANALRDLCDANRTTLAPHIAAFGQLHARLPSIPDSEKMKVIQSISSVIQALPPEEEIQPVEAIISPVVAKLAEALSNPGQLPEEMSAIIVQQLQTLTGCARGLTRTSDVFSAFDESPSAKEDMELLRRARDDPRIVRLREAVIQGIQGTMAVWAGDATIADALSDLLKSITALPSDMTLLSLPPGPLLGLVCATLTRHPNAVWLSLASMLVNQLDPPSFLSLKATPTVEANEAVRSALPVLLEASLGYLRQDGIMEAHPDVVTAFFKCAEMVVQHFPALYFQLPPGALDALMQCTITALSLQERYSLVSAIMFINALGMKTATNDAFAPAGKALMHAHGKAIMRAVLVGFAGGAPSSTMQNLIELLSTLVWKYPDEARAWVPEILFADDFVKTKATRQAKERFAKSILSSRSMKRTREAAQQFVLLAKGLDGSSFGYASVTIV